MNPDAKRLADRFEGIDRAQFAREYKIPGGAAMIYQHITGLKPISLQGAISYALAFGCSLDDISPKWAAVVRRAPLKASSASAPTAYAAKEPEPKVAYLPESAGRIGELLEISRKLSPHGQSVLIGRAQELLLKYPAAKAKPAS